MTGLDITYVGFFVVLLSYIGWVDFKRGIIPNGLIGAGVGACIVFWCVAIILAWARLIEPVSIMPNIMGGALGLGVGLLVVIGGKLTKAGSHVIGGGDIKLLFLLGLVVGFPLVIAVMVVGYFMAVMVSGLLWIYRKRIGRRYVFGKMPLAPFWCLMAITWLITVLFAFG